jgi:predicted nucleic acid-binding protein
VDTNVLFPFSVMDLMLALTEDGVHEVMWSEALLAEWERVIVREQRRSAASAASVTAAIREFFPEGEVPATAYVSLVGDIPGNDPDDRVHMAAAVAVCADVIVTWNLVDFPAEPLAAQGVQVSTPDAYLCWLLRSWPKEVEAVVVRLADEKRRPRLTPLELLERLAKAGVTEFAKRLRLRLKFITGTLRWNAVCSGACRGERLVRMMLLTRAFC